MVLLISWTKYGGPTVAGTMVPAGPCAATSGLLTGDYKWTQASLASFLDWVGAQGITKLGVWPADIAALLYKQPHYCGVDTVRSNGVAFSIGSIIIGSCACIECMIFDWSRDTIACIC